MTYRASVASAALATATGAGSGTAAARHDERCLLLGGFWGWVGLVVVLLVFVGDGGGVDVVVEEGKCANV